MKLLVGRARFMVVKYWITRSYTLQSVMALWAVGSGGQRSSSVAFDLGCFDKLKRTWQNIARSRSTARCSTIPLHCREQSLAEISKGNALGFDGMNCYFTSQESKRETREIISIYNIHVPTGGSNIGRQRTGSFKRKSSTHTYTLSTRVKHSLLGLSVVSGKLSKSS